MSQQDHVTVPSQPEPYELSDADLESVRAGKGYGGLSMGFHPDSLLNRLSVWW